MTKRAWGLLALTLVTTGAAVTEFSTNLTAGSQPVDITRGPDGNLWFTENANPGAIGRITPSGAIAQFTTGLSAAGKTTIAQALEERLRSRGLNAERLDGDVVRQSLTRDLGFSKEDRDRNIERVTFVAKLLTRNGVIVLSSFI